MKCGIYAIRNTLDGSQYIGSTIDFCKRKINHWSKLRNGKHDNIHLQRAVNKYGIDNFRFIILERVDFITDKQLQDIEQFYIDAVGDYNIATADRSVKSDATRERISKARQGIHLSDVTKQKLREVNLGKKHSKETKLKMIASRKGRKFSDEHKLGISNALRGKPKSEQTKLKMRESWAKRHPPKGDKQNVC